MKYQANPVIVDAYRIASVQKRDDGAFFLRFEIGIDEPLTGSTLAAGIASPDMVARMTPKVGDYWVIQSDGYTYLNPKDVFERKYSPVELNALELGAAVRGEGLAGQ